jgi:hypothetical protein
MLDGPAFLKGIPRSPRLSGVVPAARGDTETRRTLEIPGKIAKWNKLEHRLFCHIARNWRGRPQRSLEVIVSLIGGTTSTGLVVRVELDPRPYAKGLAVSDAELAAVRIRRAKFHGDWNDTISPRK